MAEIRTIEKDHPEFSVHSMKRIGVVYVSTERIVGTNSLNSWRFNDDWSPTVKGADSRWANVLYETKKEGVIQKSKNGPIVLFKIGEDYYVESDGNRRVSIAHMLRIPTVPAEVYELLRK